MRILKYVAAFFAMAVAASASPTSEIEALLHYVAGLDGASFVRNGTDHTPAEAEAHLRLKWTRQMSEVVTAEDFIRLCGTKSTMSGQPYMIRFKDGHEEESAQVILKQLDAIRSKSKKQASPAQAPPPAQPVPNGMP